MTLATVQILHAWSLIIFGACCVLCAVIPEEPGYRKTVTDWVLNVSFLAFGVLAMIGGVRLS